MKMKVKDLIVRLLEFPMDSTVYVDVPGDGTTILFKEDLSLDKDNDVIIKP